MFSASSIDAASKAAFYEELCNQVRYLVDGEPNVTANLANVSALLNVHMSDINWVGFYLWHEQDSELVLGPFQGKPACIRIALGKGVCGTAAQTRQAQVVPDVFAFPGHIACDADSRSEVVIPMVKDGCLLGVLDIDSPQPGRFDDEDAAGLQRVVDALVQFIPFSNPR
ncbi:GAF domain-containing protein [Alicyclobacillus cycloheptanicus]|uniref:GAF domain-containing protein n=1 Tax=Alicyclobacillus cycloheptanicus TaxID=1457 RepID=A0ABT9XFB4_9BACL|nr:GAF domain-containing protein [Alicyclobacillus cycloheptanicus]MDQ0188983.1 GAF domain-containing protein [Alicyclobacillus cycloheptanicus]